MCLYYSITKKNLKGFTLIELLVVLALVAFLSMFALVEYRDGNRRIDLDVATEKFISELEKVKANALIGVYHNNVEPASWGLYIGGVGSEYKTFADADNFIFNESEAVDTKQVKRNGSIITTIPSLPLSISFEMYTGNFFVNGLVPEDITSITLQNSKTQQTKTVEINPLGLVL